MNADGHPIDFDRLLKLRLVVARFGEMDVARWWNTLGVLGRRGATVLKRGFPSTHYFAQARIVFEVAKTRCHELFDPPGCMTLWNLPADVEDQFQERWQRWLDDSEKWCPIFQQVETQSSVDLLGSLQELDLVSQEQLEIVRKLRRSAENRAVPIPGTHLPSDHIITLLASGFFRGDIGSPAIPYARLEA